MNKEKQLELDISSSTHVRLTPIQTKIIQTDSFKSSKSVPALLKEAYFSQPPRKVLVNEKDFKTINTSLNKIGNNINQIARKLNSGLMSGWNNSLDKVYAELNILTKQIHFGYGVHKG